MYSNSVPPFSHQSFGHNEGRPAFVRELVHDPAEITLAAYAVDVASQQVGHCADTKHNSVPCPYFVHDPQQYQTCENYYYPLPRIKEHVLRHHLKAIQCTTCGHRFGDLGQLKRHETSASHKAEDIQTTPSTIQPVPRIDRERSALIRRSKASVKDWSQLYAVLFCSEAPTPISNLLRDQGCRFSTASDLSDSSSARHSGHSDFSISWDMEPPIESAPPAEPAHKVPAPYRSMLNIVENLASASSKEGSICTPLNCVDGLTKMPMGENVLPEDDVPLDPNDALEGWWDLYLTNSEDWTDDIYIRS